MRSEQEDVDFSKKLWHRMRWNRAQELDLPSPDFLGQGSFQQRSVLPLARDFQNEGNAPRIQLTHNSDKMKHPFLVVFQAAQKSQPQVGRFTSGYSDRAVEGQGI